MTIKPEDLMRLAEAVGKINVTVNKVDNRVYFMAQPSETARILKLTYNPPTNKAHAFELMEHFGFTRWKEGGINYIGAEGDWKGIEYVAAHEDLAIAITLASLEMLK